jgi:LytS/YehU family sensor histidine kinase
MQLQPHFLFNALNGVSALIHEDPDAADTLLMKLADFLRLGLDTAGESEVPLSTEQGFLCRYLEIEQIRFPDRLRVRFDIEAAALGALVPSLILQPVIENAVRHGIARREEPGRLEIVGRVDGQSLRLAVYNDGPPLSHGDVEGIGLANCRSRLAEMYGPAASLSLADDPRGGVSATVLLPLRVAQGTKS